jgi:hypothetical protein
VLPNIQDNNNFHFRSGPQHHKIQRNFCSLTRILIGTERYVLHRQDNNVEVQNSPITMFLWHCDSSVLVRYLISGFIHVRGRGRISQEVHVFLFSFAKRIGPCMVMIGHLTTSTFFAKWKIGQQSVTIFQLGWDDARLKLKWASTEFCSCHHRRVHRMIIIVGICGALLMVLYG